MEQHRQHFAQHLWNRSVAEADVRPTGGSLNDVESIAMLSHTKQPRFNNCAANEREAFKGRLLQAFDAAGYPAIGATAAARLFNYHSPVRVSNHGVRKWLVGGSIPSQAHIKTLSTFLLCDPAWLRFGTPIAPAMVDQKHELRDRVLLQELASLDTATRTLVYKFVTLLLRDTSTKRTGRKENLPCDVAGILDSN